MNEQYKTCLSSLIKNRKTMKNFYSNYDKFEEIQSFYQKDIVLDDGYSYLDEISGIDEQCYVEMIYWIYEKEKINNFE